MANDLFGRPTSASLDGSLIAFAYLAQAGRGDNDLLSGLAPIFRSLGQGRVGQKFDPVEFASAVGKTYGLKVHPWAAEDLAPRLERAGLLQRVEVGPGAHEYAYSEVTGDYSEVSEADIRLVLRRFHEYARPLLAAHGLSETDEDLEDAFLKHLVDMEFVAVLLRPDQSAAQERKPSTITLKKPHEQEEWESEALHKSRFNVLCASFILQAHRDETKLYELLVRVATGALVAEVILNFQDPGAQANLSGLTVILDAPFVMSLLDVSSEESHRFARELCEQLRQHGAQTAMFRHSVDELRDNLKGVTGAVASGKGYGPTARRIASPAFKAYVNLVLADPDAAIKRAAVAILDVPTAATSMQFCTGEEEEHIRTGLGYYESPLAQARDAMSLAGILRLRRGRRAKMGRLAQSQYVFVTQNPFVAKRPNRFLRVKGLYAEGEVPVAMTDRYLAGLLWVMFGGKSQDLPRQLLLANCAAAVEPRSDVIAQMYRFLSQVDENQAKHFRALMTEERAGQHLMQLTLGDSVLVTPENAHDVLEQMKRVLIEEHERKTAQEIDTLAKQHEGQLQAQRARTAEAEARALEARTETLATRSALDGLHTRVSRLSDHIAARDAAEVDRLERAAEQCAVRAAKRARLVQMGVGLAVAVATVLIGYFLNSELSSPAKVGLWVVAGFLTFLSFWRLPDFIFGRRLERFRSGVFDRLWAESGHKSGSFVVSVVEWDPPRVSAMRIEQVGQREPERTVEDERK